MRGGVLLNSQRGPLQYPLVVQRRAQTQQEMEVHLVLIKFNLREFHIKPIKVYLATVRESDIP
jgi:hypothetical protein